MPKVAVMNQDGLQVEEIELNESVFGITPNESVVHEAVVMQLASQRQGTSCTKSRGEVRGGGRKPFRQKGTGRARAGTSRSPLWRGGAITFGPKPRSFSYSLPKKKRRLALRSVLSAKVADAEFVIIDAFNFEAPKTKQMVGILEALKIKNTLVVTADYDENVFRSADNIPGVFPMTADEINVYDILAFDKMLITKDAVALVEEALS
jgi:large subunit ribosomal protein L4